MGNTLTKPEDLYWESSKGDFKQALQFLIDTRDYVAQLEVPEDYRQHAHSGDPNPVRGDATAPAVLDASYRHMGGDRISISVPDLTPQQNPVTFYERDMTWKERFTKAVKPGTKINLETHRINTGFNTPFLQEALIKVLEHYDIEVDYDSNKCGFCLQEGTLYVESSVNPVHFDKGRKIIQAYVHGNAQTPEELQADIDKAVASALHPQPAASAMNYGI